MANHVAVVARENDRGLPGEIPFIQLRQQASEVAVNGVNRAVVLARPVLHLIGLQARHRRDGRVQIAVRRRVFLRHRGVRRVRLAEVNQQGEGLGAIRFDETKGRIHHHVGAEAGELLQFSAHFQLGIFGRKGTAQRAGEEIKTEFAGMKLRCFTQMPLAGQARRVAALPQELGPGLHLGLEAQPRFAFLRRDVVGDAELRSVAPGQDRGPTRGTDRRADKGVEEARPFPRQPIHVRRA